MERVLAGACVIVPVVSGSMVRIAGKNADIAEKMSLLSEKQLFKKAGKGIAMCEDAKKEMEQLIREVRNMLEEDADIKRLFAKNKNTGLQVEIAGVGKVSLEEAEKLVGKDVRWSKGGSGCREKKINNPRNVERQAKKLSPEARKGYEKAIEALRSGDTRGLNDHSLSGNRRGQRAIDIKGIGKGRGAGRIIYEYGDADEINIIEILTDHKY